MVGASSAVASLVYAETLGGWLWPILLLAVSAFLVGATFCIDLQVMPREVRVVWWGRIVRSRLAIANIDTVEVVVTESGTSLFGGYSSRSSFEGALLAGAEGDRSVGNKSVRMSTEDGSVLQVGCWQPTRFMEALNASGEMRPEVVQ